MKKFFTAILLLLTISFAGCGNSNKVDKLIIGIDDEFPPLCFHDERNTLVGFDIDLAREAAERLGSEVEFKPIDWDNKREEILSGKIDLIWNGLDITDERKEYMIFTKPYMDDRQILLVKKDNTQGIYSEDDLEGKIVGTQAGSTSADYLNQNQKLKNRLKELKTYKKFNEVVAALKNGEIDVLICDELIARYEMNRHPDQFELIEVKIGSIAEMAIGFRKDNIELRDRVQEIFDDMIADGTAREISEKWFQADLIKR